MASKKPEALDQVSQTSKNSLKISADNKARKHCDRYISLHSSFINARQRIKFFSMLNKSPLLYMHCCATDKNFKFEKRNESVILAMVTIERHMRAEQAEATEPEEE
jgi:hypothetical protein